MSIRRRLSIGTTLALASLPALAHPGASPAHDLWTGLIHPVSGFDHLLMLVLLGAWLSRSGAGWRAGMALMAGLTSGIFLAGSILSPAVTEGLVIAALPVAAAAAAWGIRGPAVAAFLSAGLFFHGQAHVAGLASSGVPPAFVAGLALGSLAVLVASAFAAGRLTSPASHDVEAIPGD